MENAVTLSSQRQVLSHQELMISGGKDYIGDACAIFAFVAYSTGGSMIANPVGGAIAGFCIGYAFGSAIAGWIS